jgi:hypothetical protein
MGCIQNVRPSGIVKPIVPLALANQIAVGTHVDRNNFKTLSPGRLGCRPSAKADYGKGSMDWLAAIE